MTTDEMLKYISTQKMRGISREAIKAKLIDAGWKDEDVEEGLEKAFSVPNTATQIPTIKPIVNDKYREPVEDEFTTKKPKPVTPESPKIQEPVKIVEQPKISPISQQSTSYQIPQKENFLPNLMPKAQFIPPKTQATEDIPIKVQQMQTPSIQGFRPAQPPASTVQIFTPENYSPNPKTAVTSSYKSDYQVARATSSSAHSNQWVKRIVSIIVIVLILGGSAFAYTKGYIRIPFDLPFLKKDPREVLALVPKAQANAKSWKFEGDISLKFPSIYNIIGMMLSGDPARRGESDDFSIHNSGSFSQTEGKTLLNLFLSGTSSLIREKIETEVHSKDGITYILIPNNEEINKNFNLKSGWVSMTSSDISSLITILPQSMNVFKGRIQQGLLVDINEEQTKNKIVQIFSEAITKSQIIEKVDESIHGTPVNHYQITFDTATVKQIVIDIVKTTPSLLSEQEVDQLSRILDVLTVNNVEVWIGKADNLIYKYSLAISLPLDKILSVSDLNLSQSMATINITQTYYDYNSEVKVFTPEAASSVTVMLEEARNQSSDSLTKEYLTSFAIAANELKKAEGGYGLKSNTSGSCMSPVAGSLFSPLGHKKAAVNALGSVSQAILNIMNNTNNSGTCYSTLSAWAIAVPLRSDPDHIFCVDSKGNTENLTELLKGSSCK